MKGRYGEIDVMALTFWNRRNERARAAYYRNPFEISEQYRKISKRRKPRKKRAA